MQIGKKKKKRQQKIIKWSYFACYASVAPSLYFSPYFFMSPIFTQTFSYYMEEEILTYTDTHTGFLYICMYTHICMWVHAYTQT